jgi:aspartokinase
MFLSNPERKALSCLFAASKRGVDFSKANPNRARAALDSLGGGVDAIFLTNALQKIQAETYSIAIEKCKILEEMHMLDAHVSPDSRDELRKLLRTRERLGL